MDIPREGMRRIMWKNFHLVKRSAKRPSETAISSQIDKGHLARLLIVKGNSKSYKNA